MDLQEVLRLAQEFAKLGDAIGSQLVAVANGEPIEDQNPNALRYANQHFLQLAIRLGVEDAKELAEEILLAEEPRLLPNGSLTTENCLGTPECQCGSDEHPSTIHKALN